MIALSYVKALKELGLNKRQRRELIETGQFTAPVPKKWFGVWGTNG